MSRIAGHVVRFVIGVALFVGLPLVGWGIGDVRGFTANPARAGYLILMIAATLAAVIILPAMSREQKHGKKRVWRQHVALILLQALTLACVILAPMCDRRGIATWHESLTLRFVGLGIVVAGYVLMIGAVLALSRQFSFEVTLQKDHQLITSGLYRYIRHPRYLGILLFFTGFAVLFGSWVGVALVAVIAVVLLWRIMDEEMLLREHFGSQWDAYAARSWRLLPFGY